MTWRPERVAVLGAGVMGSQIAAHLANADVPVLLLDLPAVDGPRDALARQAISRLACMAPPPIYAPNRLRLLEPGNFADDLGQLASCDWVIEAVAERLDWKQSLWARVFPAAAKGTVFSSNTSGLLLSEIAEPFPAEVKPFWLGTHFFNPPRYMKLVELIPIDETRQDVLRRVANFLDRGLGKGVIIARDKPNFVANRVASFVAGRALGLRHELGLTIEEVDVLAGPVIGRPKTGVFALADLVGLDVVELVRNNLYQRLQNHPWGWVFRPDELLMELNRRGWLGRKSGLGFYKKEADQLLVLDPVTCEYRPRRKLEIPELLEAQQRVDLPSRVRYLCSCGGKVEEFLWPFLRDTFAFCAGCVGEVCDTLVELDRAMTWGFAWEQGPFELWDGLGVREVVERGAPEGTFFPGWVADLVHQKAPSFYSVRGRSSFFETGSRRLETLPDEPEKISLTTLRKSSGVLLENPSASLFDLGDGVACLEFHSNLNTLDAFVIELMWKALERVEQHFLGLVIGNQGRDFSVGANLALLLEASSAGDWEQIDRAVGGFQQLTQAIRYSERPVVAAAFGRTLGGGAECCLACAQVVASAETYMGLVETGIGLVPAGGGATEVLLRYAPESASEPSTDRIAGVREAFKLLGMAVTSSSAEHARELRYLSATDRIEIHPDRLIHRAKYAVLGLSQSGYRPPDRRCRIPVHGRPGLAVLQVGLHLMRQGGFISDHDVLVGKKLARILCGGDWNHPTEVSEQYLAELEREAFVSLCGEEKTRLRIEHLLRTGRPLRN